MPPGPGAIIPGLPGARPVHPAKETPMNSKRALIRSALAGVIAVGLARPRPRRRTPRRPPSGRSATASPRPGRTTAARPPTRAPGRPRRTTPPTSGNTWPRARAPSWAASSSRRAASRPGERARALPARAPDPAKAGIGLRTPHFEALAARRPALSFLEVHSENYFADGGPSLAWLERFRADYAVSLHGVGLSLGSIDPLDQGHLARLRGDWPRESSRRWSPSISAGRASAGRT